MRCGVAWEISGISSKGKPHENSRIWKPFHPRQTHVLLWIKCWFPMVNSPNKHGLVYCFAIDSGVLVGPAGRGRGSTLPAWMTQGVTILDRRCQQNQWFVVLCGTYNAPKVPL